VVWDLPTPLLRIVPTNLQIKEFTMFGFNTKKPAPMTDAQIKEMASKMTVEEAVAYTKAASDNAARDIERGHMVLKAITTVTMTTVAVVGALALLTK
jgi:hypothetical protein